MIDKVSEEVQRFPGMTVLGANFLYFLYCFISLYPLLQIDRHAVFITAVIIAKAGWELRVVGTAL